MKEKIGQLKARYLRYSPRERTLIKLCGSGATCCAIIWYGSNDPARIILLKMRKAQLQKQKQNPELDACRN